MGKARETTVKILNLLMKPEMRILPGQLAFYLVMTLIPLVALIATFAAALSISMDTVRLAILEYVPSAVGGILENVISGNGINFNIIIFYFSALLLASNGPYSMINVSNEIYKVNPKNMISRRLKAIVMTFIIVGLFLFLLIVPVFGSTLSRIVKEVSGNGTVISVIQEMLAILKYPIILLILFFNIKLMYVIAPDENIPSNTTNKGALFSSIGWILATEIFAFYIDRFARYDLFYGSISNILVLLLWVYLLSYIYVFGMIINASIYKGELE
jgi:membrane protein